MAIGRVFKAIVLGLGLLALAACAGGGQDANAARQAQAEPERETIWDLFANVDDPNTTVEVNKYLWKASLEILSFLPVEAADPFSGIIVFGYGTPPGGGRAYKATVYISDPALDARALKVAIHTRAGPASTEAVRAVEDAILTRARQLRIADGRL